MFEGHEGRDAQSDGQRQQADACQPRCRCDRARIRTVWERCLSMPIDRERCATRSERRAQPLSCRRSAARTAIARLPMKSKRIGTDEQAQVHVIILDSGEEAFAALTRFA